MKRFDWVILLLAGAGLLVMIAFLAAPEQTEDKKDISDLAQDISPECKYGIPIDSFSVVYDTIEYGQTLSDLLLPYHVSPALVDKISKMESDTFRITNIRTGNPVVYFCKTDSLGEKHAHYLVYEASPVHYTVYQLKDSLSVYPGEKPVLLKPKTAYGSIETSLWMSMVEQDLNPELANILSEIYAWSIDFFGLQKGDSYTLIYDIACVEDKEVWIDGVKAVLFTHMGEEFWAIPYKKDSMVQFFDTTGASLRKTFLKAPLRYRRISSHYSHSRLHPILKIRRPHLGVDYSAPYGTPVHSIGDGKVIVKKYGRGAGRYVRIKHNSVYTTTYMHLSKYGNIHVGDYVHQGDIIGYVGSSGLSTGPHLHFEVWRNGKKMDPLNLESPPADPVPDSLMGDFNTHKSYWVERLEAVGR